MNNYLLVVILPFLIFLRTIYADPIVNFFLYPYPSIQDTQHGLKHPGKIAHYRAEGILNQHSGAGVFSTYCGYIDITNLNGQTFYPRQDPDPEPANVIHLIVTDIIRPIAMFANTIDHFELERSVPASFFRMEKKQDEKTKLFIWDIQPESRPANNIIPRKTSLVIIADPHAIYVPTGVSMADDSPHLLLPPIYVKPSIDIVKTSLYMITISQLFGPSRILYTTAEKSYVMRTR